MSEYIEIETDISDDTLLHVMTNLTLADAALTTQEEEQYDSLEAMEEGSPVAQALSVIDGIATLRITRHDLLITRTPHAEWHAIIGDVSAALKDFFL